MRSLSKFASLAGAAALALSAPEARAQTRAIADEMHGYYEGERSTAIVFAGLGASSAGIGTVLVRRPSDWSRGLGWSMIGLGTFEAVGAIFYAFQVGKEIEHYGMVLEADPAMYKNEESTHIHGTTSRFVYYRTTEVALAVVGAGVATYGFAANKDAWKGAGIGVAVQSLTFFILDSFGTARAEAYEERVKSFDPKISLGVGGEGRPWSVDLAARF